MARKPRTAGDFAPTESKRPDAKVFAEIAGRTKSFRPARDVLRRVRAVPTIFPHLDWKLKVGGWPIDRLTFVHGPSAQGKSELVNGLGLSFLKRSHMFCLIDAERTTPQPWIDALFGDYASDPRFLASRPRTFEEAQADVERVATGIGEAKAKGRLDPQTTCLFATDSMQALVPDAIVEKMKKHAADSKDGSVDGFRGASGMVQAAHIKAWVRSLVALMSDTGCCFLGVLREAQDRDADANDRKWGNDWKVLGGDSPKYEGSLTLRVSKAVKLRADPDDRSSEVVGERHAVEVYKTKVAAKYDVREHTFFHTSSGVWTPEGYDRARDVLELGTDLEVIKKSGSWLSFGKYRWQSVQKFLVGVTAEPARLDEVEAACRAACAEGVGKIADVLGGAE